MAEGTVGAGARRGVQDAPAPLVLRAPDAAAFVGLSVEVLKAASRAGELPHLRIGYGPKGKRAWAWRPGDLTEWVESMVVVADPRPTAGRSRPARVAVSTARVSTAAPVRSARASLRQSAAA